MTRVTSDENGIQDKKKSKCPKALVTVMVTLFENLPNARGNLVKI